ncbi:MAG: zinc metallopeptidase [Firmicutes bacterium]|nr:zinc metallopeptidase [Bacillota bacterium]
MDFAAFWMSLDNYEKFYIIIIFSYIPILIFGLAASGAIHSAFKKYANVSAGLGQTAAQMCKQMLIENQLQHIPISQVAGKLTDHYDPRSQSIGLSQTVFNSPSVGAIAVACHEAGHAVQHDKKYVFSSVRSALVPIVNFTNRLIFPILLIGMLLGFLSTGLPDNVAFIFVLLGVGLFGISMIFSLVTLPVEFNASKRARRYLQTTSMGAQQLKGARKVLTAAALTYVAAFLMSAVQFLRFLLLLLMMFNRRR